MLELDGQSTVTGSAAITLSLSFIPPLDHHPCFRTLTSAQPQTKTVYRSSLNSPDSGGVGDLFFFVATFQKKKWKIIFKSGK